LGPMTVVMPAVLAAAKPPTAPDLLKPAAHGLVHSLLAFWPLWLLIGLVALGKLAVELYRLRRLSRSGIAEIDGMDGRTFEVFLSILFRRLGYSVEVTRYRGDYGADLVVKKGGRKIAVQAKRWKKRVGLKAVQEAVAAKAIYGCEGALVVANRDFTQQARRLARANKVELWDREALVSKLLAAKGSPALEKPASPAPVALDTALPELAAAPPEVMPVVAPTPPVAASTTTTTTMPIDDTSTTDTAHCTTCGVVVSAKVRDYCLARPARFGGRLYCFNHQRQAKPVLAD
jgi:restriction system protein